jgi:hypothetical protein
VGCVPNLGLTSYRRWGEVLGCGSSCRGRIIDRIKMVVPSIWSMFYPSTGKGQARITRKVGLKNLDPKLQ